MQRHAEQHAGGSHKRQLARARHRQGLVQLGSICFTYRLATSGSSMSVLPQ